MTADPRDAAGPSTGPATGFRRRSLPPPAPITPEQDRVRRLLAPYPHVASCPACVSFTLEAFAGEPDHHVQAATLSFHESGHRFDPWEHGLNRR